MRCPSGDELLAFQLGELAEPQIETIGRHLQTCARCEQHARALDSSSDLVLSALRRPIAASVDTLEYRVPSSVAPTTVGPAPEIPGYEVLGLLGRGGMSLVWKARDRRLGRLVAVKCLRADGAAEVERFRAEAGAVARLQHPHIVQIFEIGEWRGQPFLTLEFLDGGTLAEHLGGKPQDAHAAAALVQTVARAVHYAHTQGIVHRDLKPANVLLQIADGKLPIDDLQSKPKSAIFNLQSAIPKIADFGIAKHLRAAGQTREGDIFGTASYMAPEQAAGKTGIGPASDVYSLGVILYEMLTGRVPLQGPSDLDTLLLVVNQEPVSPRRLQPGLPRDLETICLKCLQKEPGGRYASALDLALDLGRFLAGEPIHARRVGLGERSAKWAKRRPAVAALLAFSAMASVVLVVGTLVYNGLLGRALEDAQANLKKALRAEEDARLAEQDKTRQLALAYMRDALAQRNTGEAGRRFKSLEILKQAVALYPGRLDASTALEFRNVAIACLTLSDLQSKEWTQDPGWSMPLACDAGLQYYVVNDEQAKAGYVNQGRLSVRRISDHEEIARLEGFKCRVVAAAFSPDGKYLAAHYDQGGRHIYIWDLSTRQPIVKEKPPHYYLPVFSPDSSLAAIQQPNHAIRVYELSTGKFKELPAGPPIRQLEFHPDGKRLVVVSGNSIHFRHVDDSAGLIQQLSKLVEESNWFGRPAFQHPSAIWSIAWRGDGKIFATGCGGQPFDVYVWDVENPDQPLRVLKGHSEPIVSLAFNRRGDMLLSESWDSSLRLWDPMVGQLLRTPASFRSYSFGHDDQRLNERWQVATGRECRTLHETKTPTWATICPDGPLKGRLMASVNTRGVQLWDLMSTREGDQKLTTLDIGMALSVHFDAAGKHLITDSKTIGLQRWPLKADPETGSLVVGPPQSPGLSAQARSIWPNYDPDFVLASDSRTIAHCPGPTGHAVLFDLDRPDRKRLIDSPGLRHAAFSPDGRWLATGNWQHHGASVWNARTCQPERRLDLGERDGRGAAWPAFSPNGKWLAIGTFDEYRVFEAGETPTWDVKYTIVRENSARSRAWAVFSPDSSMVAVCHSTTEVRLLDPATGREFARLPSSGTPYCFSPDGDQLVTYAGQDGNMHVWDLRLLREQLHEMDLDWNLPPYPTRSAGNAKPLRVTVIPGERPATSNALVAEAHVERAGAYLELRKYAHAAADLKQAVALKGKRPLWENVVGLCSEAIAKHPDDAEPYHFRADAQQQLGRWQEALGDYSQAIARNPNDAEAYHQRGHMHERLKQWQPAIDDLTQAIAGLPQRHGLHLCRGKAYFKAGENDKALEDFRKTGPFTAAGANELAWELVVSADARKREPGFAVELAKQATQEAPQEELYWNTLGVAHFRLQEWQPAIDALLHAEKLAPDKHFGFNGFFLAMCYHHLGDAKTAADYHERALRWFQQNDAKLAQRHRQELQSFQAEAEALLRRGK
jgi:WD40 repeat protein/Tfp pilus assembly protein PilF